MVTTYQYPQYLYALRTGESTQNPTSGNWETGVGAWELKGACREETNGKGHVIHAANGGFTAFASLIQIPIGTERINEGTEVVVARDEVSPDSLLSDDFVRNAKITGLIIAKGTCLKYDFGRLHCRLWI
jgi:hypothetical protein